MEASLLLFLLLLYAVLYYWIGDHDTPTDKDKKRYNEGIQLIKNKDYEEGIDYFEQALKENEKSAVAWLYRGYCNLKLENYYAAILDFSKSTTFDNDIAECYLWKGQAHFSIQEYQESFKEFDKAVWFFRSENPDAFRWRGIVRLKLGQRTSAIADLTKAEELGDEKAAAMLRGYSFVEL